MVFESVERRTVARRVYGVTERSSNPTGITIERVYDDVYEQEANRDSTFFFHYSFGLYERHRGRSY